MTSASAIAVLSGRLRSAVAAILALAAFALAVFALAVLALASPQPASAQSGGSLFSATPSTGLLSPDSSLRSGGFGSSGAPVPQQQAPMVMPTPMPMVPAGQVALALSARFGRMRRRSPAA